MTALPRLLLLWCTIPLTGWSQATKKVVEKHQNPWYTETYHVLKDHPQVKQGAYERTNGPLSLAVRGYYRAGQKDSVWTEYHSGRQVRAQGAYQQDQKVGVWEYFSYQGELDQRFDHSRHRVLFSRPQPETPRVRFRPLDAAQPPLEENPAFAGGYSALVGAAQRQVRYPAPALRAGTQGEVHVAFTVDAQGQTSNYRVVKGIGGGCDEEALRGVQSVGGEWLPARAAGQPVAAECEVVLAFYIR
jgi:TonB family protein